MSFFRHGEIFRSDAGLERKSWDRTTASRWSAPGPAPRTGREEPILTHDRLVEFPAGYSLAGCSPAEPASASPDGVQYAVELSCRSSTFHRTANSVLTVCVSPGGKRNIRRTSSGLAIRLGRTGGGVEFDIYAGNGSFAKSQGSRFGGWAGVMGGAGRFAGPANWPASARDELVAV